MPSGLRRNDTENREPDAVTLAHCRLLSRWAIGTFRVSHGRARTVKRERGRLPRIVPEWKDRPTVRGSVHCYGAHAEVVADATRIVSARKAAIRERTRYVEAATPIAAGTVQR